MVVRLSRHARNKSRHARLSLLEIVRMRDFGVEISPDDKGNRRILGVSDRGVEICLVLSLDDPEFLITLMEWRPR